MNPGEGSVQELRRLIIGEKTESLIGKIPIFVAQSDKEFEEYAKSPKFQAHRMSKITDNVLNAASSTYRHQVFNLMTTIVAELGLQPDETERQAF